METVAPHAGAWIETPTECVAVPWQHPVAPHAGAWIETFRWGRLFRAHRSHPTRVRGLKHDKARAAHEADQVAPHAGAWIETSFSARSR